MTQSDTIVDNSPFHLWDSIPYQMQSSQPDAGVAVGDTFSFYFLPDTTLTDEPVQRTSIFTEHGFVMENDQLQSRSNMGAPVWLFIVMVAIVALTTFFFHANKIKFKELAVALFDSRAMDRTLRNYSFNSRFNFVPMGMLMVAGLMLPVHQMAFGSSGVGEYLLLTVAVSVLYLLRNSLMRFLGNVFDNGAAVDTYITSNYLYHLMLVTLMLPLLFLTTYWNYGGEVVLYLLAGLVLLEWIVRLFRGMKLFLTQSSGPYVYLFYYLCIVELTPILVLVKWIIK